MHKHTQWIWFTVAFMAFVTLGANEMTDVNAHAALVDAETAPQISTVAPSSASTFYVSPLGNNQDGRTWETAWRELDQIDWDVVQPGDTILIDGGETETIYQTSLVVEKNGTPGAPITIQRAGEEGRNGKIVIFGGRQTPLPYCRQPDYPPVSVDVRGVGIAFNDSAWVVVDGGQWRGITIHGHGQNGITFGSGAGNVTVRNVEIYDNGSALEREDGWYPAGAGVALAGANISFERAIIHDNGEDAFQNRGSFRNFALRSSWLYNERMHPAADEAFNYCNHTDGIQIWRDGETSGLQIEDSIIGPGFMQGVLLGGPQPEAGVQREWAVVHDVTIRNTLFYKATNANIASNSGQAPPRNWTLDRVTSYREEGTLWHNLFLEGTGHTIRNSIFHGSVIALDRESVQTENNCQWQTTGETIGRVVDPEFEDVAEDNYSIANRACTGADVTAVTQLLATTREGTKREAPQRVSHRIWEIEAEWGRISEPFVVVDGSIQQATEAKEPSEGGRAVYDFMVAVPGDYVVKAIVDAPDLGANSLLVNIDGEPGTPDAIWDVDVTDGFEERTVSWRGNGPPDANQFDPKIFTLSAGSHQLILRGREADLRIDRLRIERVSAP